MAAKQGYRGSEVCKLVEIQPYVLRYWETEFQSLKSDDGGAGQRLYSEEDLAIVRRIRELLYEEGFTIAGAKKRLEAELAAGGPRVQPAEPEAPDDTQEQPKKKKVAAAKSGPKSRKKPVRKAKEKEEKTAGPEAGRAAELERGVRAALAEAKEILARLTD